MVPTSVSASTQQSATPVFPPTGLTATVGKAQVTLSWTAVTGASSYNVYRSTTLGTQGSKISSPMGTSYTDTVLSGGTTYYEVTAVMASGESAASSQVDQAGDDVSTNIGLPERSFWP